MLLDDVAAYLAAQSTAFTVSATGNLWKGELPDKPTLSSDQAALFETAGLGPIESFSSSTGVTVVAEQPTMQLLSRSSSYQTARNRAETAYTLLGQFHSGNLPTATGTSYLSITPQQPPFLVGRDENERYLVSVNFAVKKEIG